MWKRSSMLLVAAGLALTLSWAAPLAHAQDQNEGPNTNPAAVTDALEQARTQEAAGVPSLLRKQEETCFIQNLTCGQTVNSNLATTDCFLDSGFYVDFWQFDGQNGQTITANLSSNAFDAFLFLLDPSPEVVAVDDDSGPGTNSRIVFQLDQTSSEWTLAVSSFFEQETGAYTLSLECSGGGGGGGGGNPCPAGFFTDPQYPDFCFDVTITPASGPAIDGTREAQCLPDTVCVSGAVPGRSEAYVRILGPRPNGFLWPTVIRFTPSGMVVDIFQISSGQTNRYTLPAVVGGDLTDLSGVQDRLGFLP